MFTFRPYHFVLLGVLSVIVLLILLFLIGDARDNAALDASAARAIGLIHLGMDIDEAVFVLRKEGFAVGDKSEYKVYSRSTRYIAYVNVRGHGKFNIFDKVAIIKYVIGIYSKKNPWVVIIASLDGKIVEIRR